MKLVREHCYHLANYCSIGFLTIAFSIYAFFERRLAETHVQFSFLDFPIFVGEGLLISLGVLFVIKSFLLPEKFSRYHFLSCGYFFIIIAVAVLHYINTGPLALRNAALFYYPAFALFAFDAFRELKPPPPTYISIVLLVLLGLLFAHLVPSYYALSVWVIVAVFSLQLQGKLRWLIWILLGTVLFHHAFFVIGSRSHVLGVVAFYSCFLVGVWFFIAQKYFRVKLVITAVFLILFSVALFVFKDRSAVQTIFNMALIGEIHAEYKREVQRKEANFKFRILDVQLYNSDEESKSMRELALLRERQSSVKPQLVKHMMEFVEKEQLAPKPGDRFSLDGNQSGPQVNFVHKGSPENSFSQKNDSEVGNGSFINEHQLQAFGLGEGVNEVAHMLNSGEGIPGVRNVEPAYQNIVFRMLIWGDMLTELKEQQAWFGFGLGWPQRSKSIEILDWAADEWRRDGWITPHNSFFHIIYRFGILGVILVAVFFYWIFMLINFFLRKKDLPGLLVMGCILYWITMAQFLVVLELPYFAVPFWILFGSVLVHYANLSNNQYE